MCRKKRHQLLFAIALMLLQKVVEATQWNLTCGSHGITKLARVKEERKREREKEEEEEKTRKRQKVQFAGGEKWFRRRAAAAGGWRRAAAAGGVRLVAGGWRLVAAGGGSWQSSSSRTACIRKKGEEKERPLRIPKFADLEKIKKGKKHFFLKKKKYPTNKGKLQE